MQLLKPYDYTKLDNLITLVFPASKKEQHNSCFEERNNNKQKIGNLSIDHRKTVPDLLDDKNLRIGTFIFNTMKNLSESGYSFTAEQLSDLCSIEWEYRVLKLGKKCP